MAAIKFDPTIAFVAKTYDPRGRVTVRVHLGVLDSIIEVIESVVPLMGIENDPAQRITNEEADEAGLRLAQSLGWLTSPARHTRPTPEHDLGERQQTIARGLAIGTHAYVLAHEMGHVSVGDVDTTPDQAISYAREFAADAWATRLLLSLPAERAPAVPVSADLGTMAWPAHFTVPAAAVFLCFQAMHERWLGTDRSATHPPATERLARIRQLVLDTPRVDPDVLLGFDEIVRLFTVLQPHVDQNHPDHVLDTAEVRDWVQMSGGHPSTIPDGTTTTYRAAYEYLTAETLREIARKGTITDTDVEEVQVLVARMPGVAIELLAKAYAGTLMSIDDPDAAAIHAIGQRLVGRLTDTLLREAIIPG